MLLVCTACADRVQVDLAAGTAEASDGSRRAVTYADDALLVWACPNCDYPQAEELTT